MFTDDQSPQLQSSIADDVGMMPFLPVETISPPGKSLSSLPVSAKVFVCLECGKSFGRMHSLKRHMDIHRQSERALCPECGKSFSRKMYLIDHMRIHRQSEGVLCPKCGKTFAQMRNLT